jgi:hypothetical protein
VAYVHGRVFRPKEKLKMPSFTAKHYQAIADVIHKERVKIKTTNLHRDGEPDAITENALLQTNAFTLAMAKLFEQDNPKFKQMQFIAACNRDLVENG